MEQKLLKVGSKRISGCTWMAILPKRNSQPTPNGSRSGWITVGMDRNFLTI
jgi:hypothetical protein